MNEAIPVENDTENIILNAHVGVSSRDLMRAVWRGTTSQHGEGEECKSGYGFHCWGGRDESGAIRLLRIGGEYLRKYIEK